MPDDPQVPVPVPEVITQNELIIYSNTVKALTRYKGEQKEGRLKLLAKWKAKVAIEPGSLTLNVKQKDDKPTVGYKQAIEDLKARHPELVAEVDKLVADNTSTDEVCYLQVVPAIQSATEALSDDAMPVK